MFKFSTSILAITAVLFSFNLSGQAGMTDFKEDIPDFLKAKNMTPSVMIYTMDQGNFTYNFGEYVFDESGNPAKSYDKENVNYQLFELLVKYLDHELSKVGIEPKGYVNNPVAVDPSMTKAKKAKDNMESMLDFKSDYTLNIHCHVNSIILHRLSKGKTVDPADFRSPRFEVISTTIDQSNSNAWLLLQEKRKKMSYGFEVLASEMDKKGAGYFVAEVELATESGSSNDENAVNRGGDEGAGLTDAEKLVNFRLKANKHEEIINAWPDESELAGSKAVYFIGFNQGHQVSSSKAEKEIGKRYPYPFEVVSVDLHEKIDFDGEYRYIFLEKLDVGQSTVQSTNSTRGRQSSYTALTYYYTYRLKDMKTGILYIGPENMWSDRSVGNNNKKALKKFLKQLEKEYNW